MFIRAMSSKKTALFAALCSVLIQLWLRWRRRSRPRGAPFLEGHWLLGPIVEIAKAARENKHNEFLTRAHERLGRTYAVEVIGGWKAVVTTRPENIEHILKTSMDNYPKGVILKAILDDLLGNGIFNVDGQEWQHQRKTTSRMFTANLFKEHIWNVVRRNSRKVGDMLESTESGSVVDVFNLMNRFTLDTIGEIGFGKSIGSLEDPSSPFLKSFDRAQQLVFFRFLSMPLFWRFARILGIGQEKELREHVGRLNAYSLGVVRDLQVAMSSDSGKASGVSWADIEARKSFVGLFLEDAAKRGEELSEEYLRDLVLNFLIAGRDTTAQALSWTFFCLATHPEAEAKARQEVVNICGIKGPSYEDISRLPYLNAVVSEALRLYPSVPLNTKTTETADTLPDGTYVPALALMVYNIYGMGRDTGIWGEDAAEFRPERWLEMKETPGNYLYPVFNGGPRECLGRRLALVEMKTCLATLLPRLSLKLAVPASEITTDAQLTIGMGRGLPCFVELATSKDDLASNVSTAARTNDTVTESTD